MRRADALPIAAALLLALPLVGLAVPALIASRIAAPVGLTLSALANGEAVPAAALRGAADRSRRAAAWFEPGRHETEAAAALFAAGGQSREVAASLTVAALARNPADARNWARLAALRLRHDRNGAIAAWRQSILWGAFDPGLTGTRLAVGLRFLPTRDRSLIALLGQQIRWGARVAPRDLARSAILTDSDSFVRAALIDDPALASRYDYAAFELQQTLVFGHAD